MNAKSLQKSPHSAAVAAAIALSLTACGGGGGGGGGGEPPKSALSANSASTCRISSSTGDTQCWGQNDVGQLGIGNSTNTATPTTVTFPGAKKAKQLAHGAEHTCAILSDDTVACWGSNSAGQIGKALTTASANTPQAVSGITGAKALALGVAHTCVMTSAASNNIQCWGSNAKGQLGADPVSLTQTHTPQTVSLTATQLTSGDQHVCAATSTGVSCWGDNQFGQLGNNSTTDAHVPVTAGSLASVTSLKAGRNHTCAATATQVACWGRNDGGQLGSSGTTDQMVPTNTTMAHAGVTQLAAGQTHTCALTASNLKCWGSNTSNQLSGSASGGNTPVTVTLTDAAKSVLAGYAHTCVQDAKNVTKCWGAGSLGRLGPANEPNRLNQGSPVTIN